jgi:enamine deaminase RidA (YjgF/YER057c/UK114 family)
MIEKRFTSAPDAPAPLAAYSQAVEIRSAERVLYVSGQVPVDRAGDVPAGFRDQSRVVWSNIEAQLRAAGMTLDNLVKVTIFLSDRRYIAENRLMRKEVLGERAPALTVIIAGIFDERWLLEIEAVAAA